MEQIRIGMISAAWHEAIVESARAAAIEQLTDEGIARDCIDTFQVPGVFEIPLYAKKLARSGRYDAIIACGFVVNGGIYRHEFVSSAVIDGLMRVQLETEVPVFSAVLTPWNFHEHEDHARFFSEHMKKKGVEVARALLETLRAHEVFGGAGSRVAEAAPSITRKRELSCL